MALATTMLSGCIEVNTVPPASFTNNNENVAFDVSINKLSGNIDIHELHQLMASKQVVVEADYMPTKTIWLINATLVMHVDGLVVPVPRWVLEPQIETIRLKPNDYQISEGGHLHFEVKRKIDTYYSLHGARVMLPTQPTLPNWSDKPLRLEIKLASGLDSTPTTASIKSPELQFIFDSTRYAASGYVKASNVHLTIDGFSNITTDATSPSAQATLVGSKYAGYQEALHEDRAEGRFAGLIREARAIEKRHRHQEKAAPDGASRCCHPSPEQDDATMTEYKSWLSRYGKASDWEAISVDTRYPTTPDATVLESKHTQAKAEGHILDNLEVEMRFGNLKPSGQCDPWDRYELFFVDRRLVNYQSKQNACSDAGEKQTTSTYAKWNDQGKPVHFYQTCEPCSGGGVQIKAAEATWAAMEKLGNHVAKNVLLSPDIFQDFENATHRDAQRHEDAQRAH